MGLGNPSLLGAGLGLNLLSPTGLGVGWGWIQWSRSRVAKTRPHPDPLSSLLKIDFLAHKINMKEREQISWVPHVFWLLHSSEKKIGEWQIIFFPSTPLYKNYLIMYDHWPPFFIFDLKDIFVFLNTINTYLFSISFRFLLYQTIHQIYYIPHTFLSSHTLSYLLIFSQNLFKTKHTIRDIYLSHSMNSLFSFLHTLYTIKKERKFYLLFISLQTTQKKLIFKFFPFTLFDLPFFFKPKCK